MSRLFLLINKIAFNAFCIIAIPLDAMFVSGAYVAYVLLVRFNFRTFVMRLFSWANDQVEK